MYFTTTQIILLVFLFSGFGAILYVFFKRKENTWLNHIEMIGQFLFTVFLLFFIMHFPYKQEILASASLVLSVVIIGYAIALLKKRIPRSGILTFRLIFYVLIILSFIKVSFINPIFLPVDKPHIDIVIDTAKGG